MQAADRGQELLAVASGRPPTSSRRGASRRARPPRPRSRLVAVSIASSHGRRPSDAPSPAAPLTARRSARSPGRLQVSAIPGAAGHQLDRPRLVAACPSIRTSSRPAGRTSPIRSGHSTTRHARRPGARRRRRRRGRPRASASRYRSTWNSGRRPRVLGHQHERRRVDRVVDAEARGDPLRELRLARAELAPQADEVAGVGEPRPSRSPRATVSAGGRRW